PEPFADLVEHGLAVGLRWWRSFALPLAAILVLGSGAFEVAVLRSLELGATLLVGLVAGAWVDRLRRRPVLIWADLGRAALLASIPVAFLLGVLTYWQLLAVSGLAAILTTFFDSADNAYLPTIVERERLVDANAALAASGSASEFMAFGISGFLVQLLTAPIAIAVDAVSFVASALLLGTIRHREEPPPAKADREPVLDEIREGLRLVIHDPVLRAFAGAQMALAALWGIFGATWFLFVLEELELGPAVLGVVAGVGGFSSFIGAIAAARATRRWGIGPVAVVAMLLAAVGNAFIPLAPSGLPLIAIGCLVMQQLVADSAVTVYDITEASVRQTLVRDRALGRVASTFHVAAVLSQLTATLGAGLLAEVIGLRATSWLAPLGGLFGAVILWASPVRSLLVLPERPIEAAPRPGPGPLAEAAAAVVEAERDQPVGG
ncbi:MAG TPA: MFS transporter, partial [Candidatus Limnocylindrales bacterium]|nr:MFS transporter [Candidatus Limnocylindrales bacterium]